MRILFLCMAVLTSLQPDEPVERVPLSAVRSFIEALSTDQRDLLNAFLRATVESYSGYTLYGDKPIALEGYAIYPFGAMFAPLPGTISKIKGIELWKDLNISPHNKEYFFVIFQEGNYCHMVSINRRAFLRVVNENISLFRYVLGPRVTAEQLLDNLIDAGNDFYHVLKNDNVLLGILLGYGTENAITHARDEIITNANISTRTDKFPFLAQTALMQCGQLPKASKNIPSLGFQTLDQEHQAFETSKKNSRELKPFLKYPIPHFSCDPHSKETQLLLRTYEQNREEVVRALEGDDFLERTLRKLFTTTSGGLEIAQVPQQRDLYLQSDREELISTLTSWIHTLAKWEWGESLSQAYLRGVTDREEENTLAADCQTMEIWQTERDFLCAKNLAKANAFFKKLADNRSLTGMIPHRILYKTLLKGTQNPLSAKAKNVSFHYSFRFQGEKQFRDCDTVKQESLEHFIPGISHVLIGMKRGEERLVYIHPAYGYGENSFFPPNQAIIAKIQLIHFEEGSHEAPISAPHILETRDYKILESQLTAYKEREFYHYGAEFWNQMKKSNLVDYQTFKKHFNEKQKDLDAVFENVDQVNRFVNDLEYRLVCLQK